MWVWVNSGSWWWTGRPGVLRFMRLQRVGHDWATELNWTEVSTYWLAYEGKGQVDAFLFFSFFSHKVGKSACLSVFDIYPLRKYLNCSYLSGLSLGAGNTVVDKTVSYSLYAFFSFPDFVVWMFFCLVGDERTMVFVETKKKADFIATFLCQEKISTTSIHGWVDYYDFLIRK